MISPILRFDYTDLIKNVILMMLKRFMTYNVVFLITCIGNQYNLQSIGEII
jgi:hypothetical protein